MPLVALSMSTGKRIDITKIKNPRRDLQAGDLQCPYCRAQVVVVAGMLRTPHFRHKTVCSSSLESHPESPEHLAAKAALRDLLVSFGEEYTGAIVKLEVAIPEANRVADVLVTFPMGWRIAHEVQLASCTTEELSRRTHDYLQAGVDVIWWLGGRAKTPANVEWCQGHSEGVYVIEFEEEEKVQLRQASIFDKTKR